MVAAFTKMLFELICEKKISLKDSLEIINKKNKKIENNRISKIGNYILKDILAGSSFSNSLRKCPYVIFDDIYISFINFAEKTGMLCETIEFLNKRCERKKENLFKIIEVGIYPILVIFISAIGSLYLYYSKLFDVSNNIFIYLFILIFFSMAIFWGLKSTICENKLYEAFLAVSFLIKSGVCLYDAVGCGAQVFGVTSKNGIDFLKAREKLLLGMDLEKAFSLGPKYSDAFFFAERSGGKADIFEKIAKNIGEYDEKKRRICFSLMEPIFMLLTGIFLIILISNIFLPYISEYSFM